MNALVPLAAPAVALIGSIAALVGVWLTQRSNRQTKQIELEHARMLKEMEIEQQKEMRLVELRQEASRLFRSERRELYLELLTAIRLMRIFWINIEDAVQGKAQRDYTADMHEGLENYQALTPELEMSASAEVRYRSQVYLGAVLSSLDALSDEKYDSEDEEVRREEAVRAAKEYEEKGGDEKYAQLVEQIRGEMAHLALHPDLIRNPAENKVQS